MKPARRTPKDGKAVDAESALAEQALGLDPFARAVYVFRNRRADRIKLLLWEETRR